MSLREQLKPGTLADWVRDARNRSIELVDDLSDDQLRSPPYMAHINPLLWEIAHLTWFQEYFVLRQLLDREPTFDGVDRRYNSSVIGHEQRWAADLFPRARAYEYMKTVRDRVANVLENEDPDEETMFRILYTVYHDDMHNEAFTYTRQTLGYPPPELRDVPAGREKGGDAERVGEDVEVPGGTLFLGASKEEPFVYDHEKWAHPVEIEPFEISRTPVTQSAYRAFVEAGGYQMRSFWSDAGWRWKQANGADAPIYWRRDGTGNWLRRHFHEWVPLEPARPMVHVNYYEARAYCRWADRRLPTEAEWMAAAVGRTDGDGGELIGDTEAYPWGDAEPDTSRARLDWAGMARADVDAFAAGDSPWGCRQMIGNVWEWTASDFEPFPGFEPDFYEANAEPWFGSRKVLKGGGWPTRKRFIRTGYRNYFTPDRRDLFAGFRTCAT